MNASLFLRPLNPEDFPLLMRIFEETRPDISSAQHLSDEMRQQLVKTQFDAQHSHYTNNYPNADFGIIQYGNTAIGRIYLNRTESEIHILEFSLLSSYRSQGLGSTILRAVLKEAGLTKRPARIHVERASPAVQFYQKHGFFQIGEKPFHFEMKWHADQSQNSLD